MIFLEANRNLTLITTPTWNGIEVQTEKGPLVHEYLESIFNVLNRSLEKHPRTAVFRFDLRFPQVGYVPDEGELTRFFQSLKAQIAADDARKLRFEQRFHRTEIRFVWAREHNTSQNWHYHVAVMVNRDRFNTLGRIKKACDYLDGDSPLSVGSINFADRLRKAWASSLRMNLVSSVGLVQLCGLKIIDRNKSNFPVAFNDAFFVLSYLAKSYSKIYGNHVRNFGCSRI